MENQWKQQTIGIAGCGGLGGNLMENFLRLGITHLVVCDGDVFEYSNMDRQILCTEDSIGKRSPVGCNAWGHKESDKTE